MKNPIGEARMLAIEFHLGQTDKLGNPYWLHCEAVAEGVRLLGGSQDAIAAGWLHDLVEDTDVTLEQLKDWGFSDEVVRIVDLMTKRPGQSNDEYLQGLIDGGREPMLVKFADLMHNTRPERHEKLDRAVSERLMDKYQPAIARLARALW